MRYQKRPAFMVLQKLNNSLPAVAVQSVGRFIQKEKLIIEPAGNSMTVTRGGFLALRE
jgi:hypothetical protein